VWAKSGPAPVPFEVYNEAIRRQKSGRLTVTSRTMRQILSQLVISETTFQRLGPALNSGSSIFMYGPPGNGKTSIAHAIGNLMLSESMYIPYSVYIDGQVVKLFDAVNHKLAADDETTRFGTGSLRAGVHRDPRWVRIRRPFIVVGGELNMAGLDLVFDDVNKYYEAPFQVKANGGILLIDDFGRQQVRPRDLLNRWIVPLENRIDYLTLHTGRKVEVPFDVMVVFSTNLPTVLTPLQETQLSLLWHGTMSQIMVAVIIGHIYIGTPVGMEGAFSAMGNGHVDVNWAREHHSLWLEKIESKAKTEAPPAPAPAE